MVYPVGEAESYSTMEDFIMHTLDDFTKKNSESTSNDFWLDDSQIRTGGTYSYRYLEPGDYEAYAIGLNADGTPTGHYAKSDPFHVDQYPYTESYANLTNGYWMFEDQDGKQFVVGFEKHIVNRSLTMWGWGNRDNLEIIVTYNRNTNGLSISSQRITDGDVTIRFSDGDETGIVYLFGAYYNAQDKLRWTNQSHTITKGTLGSNGDYTFDAGYNVTIDNAGTKATKLGMGFVMYQNNSPAFGFARMMFPFTLTKIEE